MQMGGIAGHPPLYSYQLSIRETIRADQYKKQGSFPSHTTSCFSESRMTKINKNALIANIPTPI